MLKISIGRRLRATVVLRRNQPQLKSRRAESDHVANLQDSRSIDSMAVQECAVATKVPDNALTVFLLQCAMLTRYAGHVLLQLDATQGAACL